MKKEIVKIDSAVRNDFGDCINEKCYKVIPDNKGMPDKRKIMALYISKNDIITNCDSLFAEKFEEEPENIVGRPVVDLFYSYFY